MTWGYGRCGPNCFHPDCDCKPEWFAAKNSEAKPPKAYGEIVDEMDHQAKYQPATVDTRREQELRIQALGAAISRRDWHAAEQAYEAIRDKFNAPSGEFERIDTGLLCRAFGVSVAEAKKATETIGFMYRQQA